MPNKIALMPAMNVMKGKRACLCIAVLFFLAGLPAVAAAGNGSESWDNLHASGYFQTSPLYIWLDLPDPLGKRSGYEYRLQNRLNVRLDLTSNATFHWQMRTRLFVGDLVEGYPLYADSIARDDGLFDLSWTIIEEDDWILHYIPDRLYTDWSEGDWSVRVGRQRVNWGVNLITNPNDIFNLYSVYDFDYPERPGSDTLRIQRFIDFYARLELAVSPARKDKDSVAAILYAFRVNNYDMQLIGGYYRNRIATGAGWAGNLGEAGLKGEIMYFADIDKTNEKRKTNFILATSVDHVFSNSLFLVAEYLYNHEGGKNDFEFLMERLLPDNPSFSRHQTALRASYPLTPLLRTSFTVIGYPDRESAFFSPSLTWSAIENLDFKILGQFLIVDERTVSRNPVSLVTGALTYNF